MLSIFALLLLTVYMAFFFPFFKEKTVEDDNKQASVQVKKLWGIAQTSMRERKPLRAEKALLAILKLDEKNAAAYNRLGILYAKGQKFDEAIECFEIAQSLDENASSLHNVGLIYLETKEYEKAVMAFKQAIELEGDMPARYIALSKAQENLGDKKSALESLESAYNISPSVSILKQILSIHESTQDAEAIAATNARIEAQIAKDSQNRRRKMIVKRQIARKPIQKVQKVQKVQKIQKQQMVQKQQIRQDTRMQKKPTVHKIQINRPMQPAKKKSRVRKII